MTRPATRARVYRAILTGDGHGPRWGPWIGSVPDVGWATRSTWTEALDAAHLLLSLAGHNPWTQPLPRRTPGATYVCIQCGPDPRGADIHQRTRHQWPSDPDPDWPATERRTPPDTCTECEQVGQPVATLPAEPSTLARLQDGDPVEVRYAGRTYTGRYHIKGWTEQGPDWEVTGCADHLSHTEAWPAPATKPPNTSEPPPTGPPSSADEAPPATPPSASGATAPSLKDVLAAFGTWDTNPTAPPSAAPSTQDATATKAPSEATGCAPAEDAPSHPHPEWR